MEAELKSDGFDVNLTSREHVPVVENRARTIKERVRGIVTTLPFILCLTFLVYCVSHVVCMLNKVPSEGMSEFITPQLAFDGTVPDARDLLPFCQSVEAHVRGTRNINSVAMPRTESCLLLFPRDNKQHSWWMYRLDTNTIIARDSFTIVPMTTAVIAHMNSKATHSTQVSPDPEFVLNGLTLSAAEEDDILGVDTSGERLIYTGDPAHNLELVTHELELHEDEERPTNRLHNDVVNLVDAKAGSTLPALYIAR